MLFNSSSSRTVWHKARAAKHTWLTLCIAAVSLAVFTLPAQAGILKKQLHFEWTYSVNLSTVAGYKIYQNGKSVAYVNSGRVMTAELNVDLITDQPNKFTITAFDLYGKEGLPSSPYIVDLRGIAGTHCAVSLLLLRDKERL